MKSWTYRTGENIIVKVRKEISIGARNCRKDLSKVGVLETSPFQGSNHNYRGAEAVLNKGYVRWV